MYEVTTESGAKYHLDVERLFWRKVSRQGISYPWERLWEMKHADERFPLPWTQDSKWEPGLPEVGQMLYVASRDVWWVSTPVVSIEEVEE